MCIRDRVFAAERYAGYKSCLEAAGLAEPACGAAKGLLTPADIAAYVEDVYKRQILTTVHKIVASSADRNPESNTNSARM